MKIKLRSQWGCVDCSLVERRLCILWEVGLIPGGYPERIFQEDLRARSHLPTFTS